MIRKEAWLPGTVLAWKHGLATVTDLPMIDWQ